MGSKQGEVRDRKRGTEEEGKKKMRRKIRNGRKRRGRKIGEGGKVEGDKREARQMRERENRRKGKRRDKGGGEVGEGVNEEENSNMSRIPSWVWKHTCNPGVQETEVGGLCQVCG